MEKTSYSLIKDMFKFFEMWQNDGFDLMIKSSRKTNNSLYLTFKNKNKMIYCRDAFFGYLEQLFGSLNLIKDEIKEFEWQHEKFIAELIIDDNNKKCIARIKDKK